MSGRKTGGKVGANNVGISIPSSDKDSSCEDLT